MKQQVENVESNCHHSVGAYNVSISPIQQEKKLVVCVCIIEKKQKINAENPATFRSERMRHANVSRSIDREPIPAVTQFTSA